MSSLFVKRAVLAVVAGVVLMLPVKASAAQFTFTPSPVDLNDLDHHMMYSWRVDGVNLAGGTITSATLAFSNIYNWDTNPAILYLHLFDTAVASGVHSYTDDASTTPTTFNDNFKNSSQAGFNTLVGNNTLASQNTFLTAATAYATCTVSQPYCNNVLSHTASNYTYTLTSSQLTALSTYIASGGDFALGFDPDCHFFNDGITFTINTDVGSTRGVVPEPASLTLLTLGLAGAIARRRQLRAARG